MRTDGTVTAGTTVAAGTTALRERLGEMERARLADLARPNRYDSGEHLGLLTQVVIANHDEVMEGLSTLTVRVEDGFASVDRRFAKVDERFDRLEGTVDSLARDVRTTLAHNERLIGYIERQERVG